MNTEQTLSTFIDFFRDRGHQRITGSTLLPSEEDRSVLFTDRRGRVTAWSPPMQSPMADAALCGIPQQRAQKPRQRDMLYDRQICGVDPQLTGASLASPLTRPTRQAARDELRTVSVYCCRTQGSGVSAA